MEIRNSIVFMTLCTLIVAVKAVKANTGSSGYIFTSPRTLKVGTKNQLQLLRFGNLDAGSIKVSLYYKENYDSNETLLSQNEFQFPQGQKQTFFKLFVAPFEGDDDVYGARIQINGSIGDEVISGSDDVNFSTVKNDIIVIQTDKPLYKPGQYVRWRVLKVNNKLKPSLKKTDVGQVYIEDPTGTRLFQSENVYLGKGLAESKFLLADEPLLGIWKITLNTGNYTETANFDVLQYELPKFEVNIKFPPFTLATAQIIPIQVCANFTDGKPVVGHLNLNISYEDYYYYYDSPSDRNPVVQVHMQIDGCYTYNLNVSLLQSGDYQDYYTDITVLANVIQDGTGVQINDTETLSRTTTPLNLNFNTDDDQSNYFKPGLPYNGKVIVTNPDNTPAPGEAVLLTYTVNKQRVIAGYLGKRQVQYSKNFTSDAKGFIRFTIPPQNIDTTSVDIQAQTLKYSDDSVLNGASAYLSLSPFYSPSGSYIQLANVGHTILCDTKQDFRLLFTSKENADFKFFYEVISHGNVVQSGTKQVSFFEEDDISHRFENDNRLINHKEEQIVPSPEQSSSSSSSSYSSSEENCPAARESRYVPPVGEVKINIDVDYKLSDAFTLLVFYIRDDKETVADSRTFQVQKCFKNKVNFQFLDTVKQPGQNTTIKVTASPNSLCGIKAIDKSVTLLDNSGQVTTNSIFQLIDAMNTDDSYVPDICSEGNPHQPGLSSNDIILPPGSPDSSSSSDDSYSVFLKAGFLVISDLRLFTRRCNNNNGGGVYYGAGRGRPIQIIPAGPERFPELEDDIEPDAQIENIVVPQGSITAQSAVKVRSNFPETWLFEMEMLGPSGVLRTQKTLPDTITEWIGSAVCVSPTDGLGVSNTTSIKGFQLFFISYTLPISVIRGEQFTITVSIFSYANGALPVSVSLDDPQGFEVVGNSINGDICIQPGTSQNFPLTLQATKVGKINITVRAETARNSDVCGSSYTSSSYARDAIEQSLDVEAEGFPVETVQGILFCPLNLKNQTFDATYPLNLPSDVVNDSSRAFVDVTGNILGPTIQNVNNLVQLPTGCGEQNLVKFVPNYLVLDYLSDIGELTDSIRSMAIQNLNTGYQRELTYRHYDGSFSAFGPNDGNGSMFLTAFVVRSFSQAKQYITIDDSIITKAQKWITDRQQPDGCFPDYGKIIDTGIQGGIENDKSLTTITAYVLASLLISNYENQTIINNAEACLKQNPPSGPYETFLVAYADALGGRTAEAQQLLEDIKPFAQSTEGGVETYFNPNGTQAVDLETVAYAVLTNIVLQNDLEDILPLVRDLTQNLKPTGGFYSTQDTCVGLAALSGFAKLVYGKPININVIISGGLNENVQITQENKLLVQRNMVSRVPSNLEIKATGSGCGLIQLTFRYNSKTPPSQNKFYIKVVGECIGADCGQRKISGRVRYLPAGKAAGFSVVTIKMISGIVPDRDSITQIPVKNKDILRADVEDNNVILYFNEITNKGQSFGFQVNEGIPVSNPQPGSATIVDYYAPEISSTTIYAFDNSTKSSTPATNKTTKTVVK